MSLQHGFPQWRTANFAIHVDYFIDINRLKFLSTGTSSGKSKQIINQYPHSVCLVDNLTNEFVSVFI